MSVFVILALAVAAMCAAVLVLAGLQLWRALKRLAHAAEVVRDRLTPLTEELQAELAVTGTETAALQQSLDAWQAERDGRRREREGVREGLRRSVRGS